MRRIGLFGNPNCGKTTLFNRLTGLNQKTGNFPGVTVDKKQGLINTAVGKYMLIDFPGTYSLYPSSRDERVVLKGLLNEKDSLDLILYVADIEQLERHLLLFSQLRDTGIPCILTLNMIDIAKANGLEYSTDRLSRELACPVVGISSRTGEGINEVKELIDMESSYTRGESGFKLSADFNSIKEVVARVYPSASDYLIYQFVHHASWLTDEKSLVEQVDAFKAKSSFVSLDEQMQDTMQRFDKLERITQKSLVKEGRSLTERLTARLDEVVTHRVFGPILFFALMMFVFQAIYAWASYPMDLIDGAFAELASYLGGVLPEHWLSSLIVDGIVPGIGGVVIFIPQIAILFLLISLLEEIGYMARVAFMFDRIMQYFGLNGRSLVAMVSSAACAIPAVMSTRTISDWKERIITIMVAPLISCSARIPVYAVLVGFVVPRETVFGIFNLQGLAFGALYLLGIVGALLSALLMKFIIRSNHKSYLLLEMPGFKKPDFRNVGLTVWEKVRTFVWEAGKVIFVISIVLWGLSSYGPREKMAMAEQEVEEMLVSGEIDETGAEVLIATKKLENSYAGHMGKFIEPVIAPLGFDWKMGIALITSFAAREVFVGTMATLYAVGDAEDEAGLIERMEKERHPVTGKPLYSIATALSLLLFYVFAMQCMSTLAVVKRETKSWKWPLIQFSYMTALAYFSSLLAYTMLS